MTAKASYEKEFYFFDKFTIPSGCGAVTYTLKDTSNVNIAAGVATIDEIPLVPGKMRIYLKDSSTIGTHTFTVTATNTNGIASAAS